LRVLSMDNIRIEYGQYAYCVWRYVYIHIQRIKYGQYANKV